MTNHRSPDAARAAQDPQNTPTDPTPAPTPQPNPPRHLYGLPIASGTLGDTVARLGAAAFKGQPCVLVQPANSDGWLMIRDHQGQVLEVHRDELNGGAL